MKKATIRIEMEPSGVPRPTGAGVFIDGELSALLDLEELDKAYAELTRMREARANLKKG